MKIAAGVWRGRILRAPRNALTRPTQDRVREALFDMLRPILAGKRFLDLYAGSGAVGLEALSQGAASADFLERERVAMEALRANLAACGADPAKARPHALDVAAWLSTPALAPHGPWDIVFADPPYAAWDEEGFPVAFAQALLAREALTPGAFLILESDRRLDPPALPGLECVRDRQYGKTRLFLYRR